MSERPETAGAGRLVDLHCHILPGLDDGAANLDVSLAMARKAAADGVGTIVATPHVFRDGLAFEDPGMINRKCQELSRALCANGIPIKILPGAEVHVSHDLVAEIRARKKLLVLNGSSYLCIEFPEDLVFSGTKDLFFELMSDGITPIIAHPERNSVFGRDPKALYELIRMGALSQANSGSLSGQYGTRAYEAVCVFMKSNLVHFLASDAHDEGDAGSWLSGAVGRAAALVGKEASLAMVRENPLAVISDRPLPHISSPIVPGSGRKSFKIHIPNILRHKP